MAEISKTGVWLDEDGRVVTSPPERGTQLVAPGCVPDGFAQRMIAAAKPAPKPELEPEPGAAAKSKRKPRPKPKTAPK